MTLIELVVFLLMLGIGGKVAAILLPIGGLWLAIAGFVAGTLFLPFLFFLHTEYRKWAYRGDKSMPDCSCGSSDYKYQMFGAEMRVVCQHCGAHYEKKRHEVSVFENDEKKPFKRLVKHQGWI